MSDFQDVQDLFKKIVDDAEAERLEKERVENEKAKREMQESASAAQPEGGYYSQPMDVHNETSFNAEEFDISENQPSSQPAMSYTDVDAFFKQKVEEAEREKKIAERKSENFDNGAPSDFSPNYYEYDSASIARQPLSDGTAYRPILEEIISNSQKGSMVPENLKAKKHSTLTSENIALMQNLESGLSILKAELKNQNYNLRPYTKFNSSVTYYENSHVFTSRIRFEASIYTALIFLIEIFAAFFIVNALLPQKILYYYIAAGVVGLILLIASAFSLILFNHKRLDRYSFKTSFLTALVILFPAMVLIILYALFIGKIEVNSISGWLYSVIYPILVSLNLIIYVIMYNLVYRTKRHHLK